MECQALKWAVRKTLDKKKKHIYEGIKSSILSVEKYLKQKEHNKQRQNIIFLVCPCAYAGYLMLLEASTSTGPADRLMHEKKEADMGH